MAVQVWKCLYSLTSCIDHASWDQAGFPAAAHFEGDTLQGNPNIHTAADHIDTINWSHLNQMAKVVAGFAAELGGGSFSKKTPRNMDEDFAWIDALYHG